MTADYRLSKTRPYENNQLTSYMYSQALRGEQHLRCRVTLEKATDMTPAKFHNQQPLI